MEFIFQNQFLLWQTKNLKKQKRYIELMNHSFETLAQPGGQLEAGTGSG
jgi:hypothetical protein